MSLPEKRAGFRQDIYETSTTAKEMIGVKRTTSDGRVFRYALSGVSALSPGKMAVAVNIMASVMNKTAAAAAVGAITISLPITAPGVAIVENYYRGGYLQINDAVGEGRQYPIEGSSAVTVAGTSITLSLRPPGLKDIALTTASEFTLVHSPWAGTVESATATSFPVGVTPVSVSAANYYWAQTGGVANVLIGATVPTPAVGGEAILATTAGSVTMASSTYTGTKTKIGRFLGTVGVATEYKPIFLTID